MSTQLCWGPSCHPLDAAPMDAHVTVAFHTKVLCLPHQLRWKGHDTSLGPPALSGAGGILGSRDTTMPLAPLDSLLPSLPVSPSLGVQWLCHFLHMARGSGSALSKTLSLTDTVCSWVGVGGDL